MTWVAGATGRPPVKFLHGIEPAGGSVRYRCQMTPLKISYNREQSLAVMESRIKLAARKGALRILEAGCGTIWPLRLEGVEYQLTGVDVDRDALAVRQRTARPTDRLMHGDLRSRELFAAEEFDAIYNSFVLEHVDGAERVLDNFMYWLKPGGTLILRIPDGDSVYGFVTRMTPFWFHVLIKKYVQKLPNAGKPGYDPFRCSMTTWFHGAASTATAPTVAASCTMKRAGVTTCRSAVCWPRCSGRSCGSSRSCR
jgi:SAM-dependent methyltransferase